MSKPNEFLDRLTNLAANARHHPEPAVAVSLLAQLLLDIVTTVQPFADRYAKFLGYAGTLDALEKMEQDLFNAEANMAARALEAAEQGQAVGEAAKSAAADQLGATTTTQDSTGTGA